MGAPAEQHAAIGAHVERGRLKSGPLKDAQDVLQRPRAIAVRLEPFEMGGPIGRIRKLPMPLAQFIEQALLERGRTLLDLRVSRGEYEEAAEVLELMREMSS